MHAPKALIRLNQYFDKNKAYYASLETAIVAGILYSLHIFDYLLPPWITQHISNLIGATILTLVIVSPASFRMPKLHVKRIYFAIGVTATMNIWLELSRPINTIDLPFLYWQNFNTPDPIDAVFGVVGALVILMLVQLPKSKT